MPRSMVGLLATLGAAMSVVAGLAHGDLFWAAIAAAAAATGLAAYLALPPRKKAYIPVVLAGLDAAQLALPLSSEGVRARAGQDVDPLTGKWGPRRVRGSGPWPVLFGQVWACVVRVRLPG